MKLNQNQYAKHRARLGLPGRTRSAVGQAVAAGRIELDADGLIDPEIADRQWEARTAAKGSGAASVAPKRNAAPSSAGTARRGGPRAGDEQHRAQRTTRDDVVEDGRTSEWSEAFARARAEAERLRAESLAIDVAKKRGELVDRADLERRLFAAGRQLRDRLLAIPRRLAPVLALEGDPVRVEEEIRREIAAALGTMGA